MKTLDRAPSARAKRHNMPKTSTGTDNKKSIENTEDFFDEDFEVIYQEEDYTKFLRRELRKTDDEYEEYSDGRYYDDYHDDYHDDYYDHGNNNHDNASYNHRHNRDYDYGYDSYHTDNYGHNYGYDSYHTDSYDDYDGYGNYNTNNYDDYDDYDDYYDHRSYHGYDYNDNARNRRRNKFTPPNLLSPAAKTATTGGKIVFRLAGMLLRSATLILIAAITYILAVNFWKNHGTYGDIIHALTERNYILAAYAAVAVFLLLFECLSFLLVLATSKRNDRRGRRVDTGRGLFSFLLIYAGSYLAYFLNGLIPYSPAPLMGVQGALKVYGSLRFTLLPLCVAGIISCLVRKFVVR